MSRLVFGREGFVEVQHSIGVGLGQYSLIQCVMLLNLYLIFERSRTRALFSWRAWSWNDRKVLATPNVRRCSQISWKGLNIDKKYLEESTTKRIHKTNPISQRKVTIIRCDGWMEGWLTYKYEEFWVNYTIWEMWERTFLRMDQIYSKSMVSQYVSGWYKNIVVPCLGFYWDIKSVSTDY